MFRRPQPESGAHQQTSDSYRPEPFRYGWGMFYEDIEKIWSQLKERRNSLEWVLAIERGGVCAGAVLADRLHLPLYTLRVRGYVGRQKLPTLQVGWVPEKIRGSRVALVDDIVDGGRTFQELGNVLSRSSVQVVDCVALCRRSGLVGDYIYGREIEKGIWVNFPWWFAD